METSLKLRPTGIVRRTDQDKLKSYLTLSNLNSFPLKILLQSTLDRSPPVLTEDNTSQTEDNTDFDLTNWSREKGQPPFPSDSDGAPLL